MIGQTLFFVVLAAWIAFDVYVFAFRDRARGRRAAAARPAPAPPAPAERRSKWVMLGCIVVGMMGGIFVSESAQAAWLAPFTWSRSLGVGLLALSVAGRVAIVRWFGAAFTVEVRAIGAESLRTSGPYRWVRHPAYAAEILAFAGVALAYHHPLTSTLAATLPTAGVLYRVRVEEAVLRAALGDVYAAYCRRTKRLIPLPFGTRTPNHSGIRAPMARPDRRPAGRKPPPFAD